MEYVVATTGYYVETFSIHKELCTSVWQYDHYSTRDLDLNGSGPIMPPAVDMCQDTLLDALWNM